MRVEVMEHYGLAQPIDQAGYYETAHHKQLIKDIRGAIHEGRLIAVCGVVGSGKTVTLRRWHCCKVSDEAAFCLIQRPYISKTLLTRRISPRGSP